MMKLIFLSGLFFTISFAHAKPISVDWNCPKSSIELSFNDQGKLQFKPDVFSENKSSLSAAELSACISAFQKSTSVQVEQFKKNQCPSSKSDFCYSSVSYVNDKVFEKIKDSNLVKKTSGVSVSSITPSSTPSSSPGSARAYLEEKIAKKEIDPKNLGQSFSFQDKTYKVSDFDDVVGDNVENVFVSLNRDEAKQYAQNYLVSKSNLLNAKTESPQRTKVLNNLNQMFGYIYGDKGAEELAKILECKPEDNLKPIEDIIKNIEDTTKVAKCAELKVGEHKVYGKDNNYYSTGNYTLKRKQDGNYQAILNVKFTQKAGSVTGAAMLERAQKCMALAAPYMKGPDGNKLEMVILPPDEISKLPKDEQPKQNNVTVEASNYGTNSGGYAENVNCGVITHELLHLMGLCDEYKEDRPEYASMNWTCRVVTKLPSVMRDTRAFEQATGQPVNCGCTNQSCSTIMNSSDENLKKIYTGAGPNDLLDYRFRNSYCKEEFTSNPPKSMDSDKAMIIDAKSDLSFQALARYISVTYKAPYYAIVHSKIKCACPAGNQECLDQKKEFESKFPDPGVKKTCPVGAPLIDHTRGDNPLGVSFKNNTLSFVAKPTLPSLLQPNHFNKILEGSCPGKSDGYQHCAAHAYKGEPCNVPSKCQDDNYYLGGKQ